MKVIGIRLCAPPPTPAWVRPRANVDEVAAATIPRGAIQAMKARSRIVSAEPRVEPHVERAADEYEHADEREAHPAHLADLVRGDAGREDDEQDPDQEGRESGDSLAPGAGQLCRLDRQPRRLDPVGWPVDEDRADEEAGDQARVIAEQVGTDDHRNDEHQGPGQRLRLVGSEPARPGQDQDPPTMPKPAPIPTARRN